MLVIRAAGKLHKNAPIIECYEAFFFENVLIPKRF